MRGAKRSSTAWIALLLCTSSADALSAPTTPSPPKWSVALNLGREPGSSMPKSWAASGARFFLQADVDFLDLPGDASEPFLGRGGVGTAVAASATFTGLGGKQTVAAGTGAWVLTRNRVPNVFRFWLDMSEATGVESRGVELPAERLYFTASAFDEASVADAKKGLLGAKQGVFAAQADVDGFDAAKEAPGPLGLLALTKKVDALNAAKSAVSRLELRVPDGNPTPGYLPTSDEKVILDSGSISVRRRGLLPGFGDKYFVVGRWTATPVLEGAELAASKRLYYDVGAELGSGAFASVHEATHRASKDRVAVKHIEKGDKDDDEAKDHREMCRREIAVMRLASHKLCGTQIFNPTSMCA